MPLVSRLFLLSPGPPAHGYGNDHGRHNRAYDETMLLALS